MLNSYKVFQSQASNWHAHPLQRLEADPHPKKLLQQRKFNDPHYYLFISMPEFPARMHQLNKICPKRQIGKIMLEGAANRPQVHQFHHQRNAKSSQNKEVTNGDRS